MSWVRVDVGFDRHPKFKRLVRRLGVRRVEAKGLLVGLWTWVMEFAPDGALDSFDVEAIEDGAEWEGTPGAFFNGLVEFGLIDKTPDGTIIHDWTEYAAGLKAAMAKAKQRERKRAASKLSEDCPWTVAGQSSDSPATVHEDRRRGPTNPTNPTDTNDEEDASSSSSSLVVAYNADAVVLEFPIDGGGAWSLTRSKMLEFEEDERYRGIDVLGEFKEAHKRIRRGNRDPKGTPREYLAFLSYWLDNVLEHAKSTPAKVPSSSARASPENPSPTGGLTRDRAVSASAVISPEELARLRGSLREASA